MFEHLTTPEAIETYLAEQRRRLPDGEWRQLVQRMADEMAERGQTPFEQILQRLKVFKRATDQLELPPGLDLEPPVSGLAESRGWRVLEGGRRPDGPGGYA